jgi:sodium transport system ATP-binding protein
VPTTGDVTVALRGLTKIFRDRRRGEVRAVDDLTFEARAGEVFGLLGVNGAGKTTALRLLSTMLTPSAGDAEVCGFSVRERPEEVRRRIGFLSTTTSLYRRLTARELIAYFGRLNGLAPDRLRRRTEELLDLFAMRDFADVRCDALSTGMKQKVSIARTVVHDPELLILDEPTLGLDVLTGRVIVEFIKDCRRRGCCVLLSTHVMEEVEKLCDRVGVIHGGRLRACEATDALRARTSSGRVEDAFIAVVGEAA